jgi:uncharacterized membrane protein
MAGGTVALLLTWMGLWMGVGPEGVVPAVVAIALAWMPLLPAVPALLRGGRKAAGWCSMVGVFYAGFAIMELAANPASGIWAAVALALSEAARTRAARRHDDWRSAGPDFLIRQHLPHEGHCEPSLRGQGGQVQPVEPVAQRRHIPGNPMEKKSGCLLGKLQPATAGPTPQSGHRVRLAQGDDLEYGSRRETRTQVRQHEIERRRGCLGGRQQRAAALDQFVVESEQGLLQSHLADD